MKMKPKVSGAECLFSQGELRMIKAISLKSYAMARKMTVNSSMSMSAPRFLELVALKCFLYRREGKAVDALRRALHAIREEEGIYRKTPAYEKLLRF